ncbi:MAG: hypothetical protein HY287_07745 [Planctomycetes bacterium]|nr:hypothetical protein [Planctomycetota bacterium]MBI3834204.1 hypothetical protein [Planctomycetota bacterium]
MKLSTRFSRRGLLAAAFLCGLFGCGSVGNNGLPNTVTVNLPDGTQVQAALGEGVPSLASSKWDFYQDLSTGQTLPFITINFGPNGELDRFENNTIANQIFGDVILFDGQQHPTAQQAISYAAATYGAETSDASGFAFEGHLTAFAVGFTAATATATASGTFDAADPNTMHGTFSFTTQVNVPGIQDGNMDESFNFVATRVAE